MPELPEVETIKIGLKRYLIGHSIENIIIKLPKLFTGDSQFLLGAKVADVRRFGKGLVIDFDNAYSLAVHVKMTGQFIYTGKKVPENTVISAKKVGHVPNLWTHIIFYFDDNAVLYYNDVRQFSWLKIIKTSELFSLPFFKTLGPDPLTQLSPDQFGFLVKRADKPIKTLLLDQKEIAGIGNIYANDALFVAGIDPRIKGKNLTSSEVKKLYRALLKVLQKGLEEGGASEMNYVNALGEEGGYQHHFQVYGRENKPCLVCKTKIEKIKLSGRGTYFCPKCQK